MMPKPRDYNFLPLDKQLKEAAEAFGLIDPMILLIGVANGQDLSKQSQLYDYILELEDKIGCEPPCEEDWWDLLNMIKANARYRPVSERAQGNAQKTLAEYMHSKKKSLEITDNSPTTGEVADLSKREMRRFRRVFRNDY